MGSPIQPLARGFLMVDGTGSPQTSPIGSGSNDEVAIVVPSSTSSRHCFRLHVHAPSAAITLRKVSGGATGGTFTIAAATVFAIPVTPGDTVYLARGGSATTIEFLFEDMF